MDFSFITKRSYKYVTGTESKGQSLFFSFPSNFASADAKLAGRYKE